MNVLPALALAVALVIQGPPPDSQNGPTRSGPGPWDNDVLVHRLDDSGRFEQLATFDRAGVPTVGRMPDGRLIAAFQSFPADDNRNFDRVAVRFSSDEGRTWTAADLAGARELVRASRTAGAKVTVWATPDYAFGVPVPVGRYFVRLLR